MHHSLDLKLVVWIFDVGCGTKDVSPFRWQMQALFRIGKGGLPLIPSSLSVDAQDFIYKCLQVIPDDRPTAAQLLDHPFVKRQLSSLSVPPSLYRNGTRA